MSCQGFNELQNVIYEGPYINGKQRFVAFVVHDLVILIMSQPENCLEHRRGCNCENNQDLNDWH